MIKVNLPTIESDNNNVPDIDPFTIVGLFNYGNTSDRTRIKICEGYKNVFDINAEVPSDFSGIPKHNYNNYCFYYYLSNKDRVPDCFTILWRLFELAIGYSKDQSDKSGFEKTFNQALMLPGVGLTKLTVGLFHIRPKTFVSLDNNNKSLIKQQLNKETTTLSGVEYLDVCSSV